jgi:hypothetical protein
MGMIRRLFHLEKHLMGARRNVYVQLVELLVAERRPAIYSFKIWDDFELVNACEAAFPPEKEVLSTKNGSTIRIWVNLNQ